MTYAEDCRIIWDLWRWRRLGLFGCLFDPQVLDITAAEDNIIVDTIGARELFGWVASSAFCAIGLDLLERNGRVFGIDLV